VTTQFKAARKAVFFFFIKPKEILRMKALYGIIVFESNIKNYSSEVDHAH